MLIHELASNGQLVGPGILENGSSTVIRMTPVAISATLDECEKRKPNELLLPSVFVKSEHRCIELELTDAVLSPKLLHR